MMSTKPCLRDVAEAISFKAPRGGKRLEWGVTLECGHGRSFRGEKRPRRLNCLTCRAFRTARENMVASGEAARYDPELIRLLQGEWVGDCGKKVRRGRFLPTAKLLVVCDYLEELGDPRASSFRRLVNQRRGGSSQFVMGPLVEALPEIRWAWYSDPTLWPFPDMGVSRG